MKKLLFLLVSAFCSVFSANAALSETDFANNDYTGEWGRLKLVDKQLSSADGNAIQLKGWSTFSIHYGEVTNCLSESGFDAMKAWGANVVRLAVYPNTNSGGYVSNPSQTIENVKTYIKYCKDRNMYVLVDWHVLKSDDGNSGDPSTYASQAKDFFTAISKWASANNYTNVLYETCNEPSGVEWSAIKSYAQSILSIINSNDPGAIVIVGTPNWDQYILQAANSPISASSYNLGIMYAFHFYAGTHDALIYSEFSPATAKIPVFVSEWGSSDANGTGNLTDASWTESSKFLAYCNKDNDGGKKISWCYWSWGEKKESSACIINGKCGHFDEANILTAAGTYITQVLTGKTTLPTIPKSQAFNGAQPIPVRSDTTAGELNIGWYDNGGAGIAYYDANSSMYTDDEHTKLAATGTTDESWTCNSGAYYSVNSSDAFKAAATTEDKLAIVKTQFRSDECVDVTNQAAGPKGDYTSGDAQFAAKNLHNLCMTESGEWINYTINVLKAGYYSLQALTTMTTQAGTVSISKIGKGNIVRNLGERETLDSRTNFGLKIVAKADCPNPETPWTCWAWTDVQDPKKDDANIGVVFYKTGEQTIQIQLSPDNQKLTPGDFGNLKFTFVDDNFSAAEKVFEETTGVETIATTPEFSMYPNPSNGSFTIDLGNATDAANVTVMDMTGRVAYTEAFVGKTTINKTFNKGVYVVRVQTAGGVKTQKMNVE